MKILVVGGKLQGVEATYLAHQAGWHVILIDKDSNAPAVGLCDEYYQLDVNTDFGHVRTIISNVDFVIPAIEDEKVLKVLDNITRSEKVPFLHDDAAFAISSSKKKSDSLFERITIPAPRYWPKCNLPVIAKPSGLSGSQGVRKINEPDELAQLLIEKNEEINDWIIQEYVEGPSYSLEVIGFQGKFLALQVTDLQIDQEYDCKRVLAPTKLTEPLIEKFKEVSLKIAEALDLTGIMDVEVIEVNGLLKVLEIDARLPSQTPTVVYKSTGVNMLESLFNVYVLGQLPDLPEISTERAVIYEHIKVCSEGIEVLGEHIMATAGPLSYAKNFFGCDEVITNFSEGKKSWVATLIITGDSQLEVLDKRKVVLANIKTASM